MTKGGCEDEARCHRHAQDAELKQRTMQTKYLKRQQRLSPTTHTNTQGTPLIVFGSRRMMFLYIQDKGDEGQLSYLDTPMTPG